MRIAFAALLVLALLPAAGALAGGQAPRQLRTCQTCHGEDGVAVMAGTANLSGQQKEYLVEQLRAFRSGRRQDPQMSIIAKSLSDDDIEQLSQWYSSIRIKVEKPK